MNVISRSLKCNCILHKHRQLQYSSLLLFPRWTFRQSSPSLKNPLTTVSANVYTTNETKRRSEKETHRKWKQRSDLIVCMCVHGDGDVHLSIGCLYKRERRNDSLESGGKVTFLLDDPLPFFLFSSCNVGCELFIHYVKVRIGSNSLNRNRFFYCVWKLNVFVTISMSSRLASVLPLWLWEDDCCVMTSSNVSSTRLD